MRNARQTLDASYLEMRWRALSLAADLDRIQRAEGGPALIASDPRIKLLREAFGLLLSADKDRAEKLQMILSDKTPPPTRESKDDLRRHGEI